MGTVLIASDHAGYSLKSEIQKLLPNVDWMDLGPVNSSRVDYPDFAERVSENISRKKYSLGILICGSGIGMSIAANKFPGVRAAVVENPVSARLAREHNDANILCLGSRFLAPEYAAEIVNIFLSTAFSKDERHQSRIEKIKTLESRSK